MIPRSLQVVAGVSFALGLAFWVGRLSRPGDDEASAELVALRHAGDSLRKVSVADSLALVRAEARTDSAIAVATRARAQGARAAAVSAAYRDTVRVLNDSLVSVVSDAGVDDTMPLPAPVIDRLRADAATIASQAIAIEALDGALKLAQFERDTAHRALASANNELGAFRVRMPLEIDAAYARGKRDGTRKGIVLGSIGTLTVVFTGVKVVAATRLQSSPPSPVR
jgi:hypothetical protein